MSRSSPTKTGLGVRRRLKTRADALGLEFQQAILYYAIERFLFRLSKTGWADRLIVKGATMLRVWDSAIARPTRDIDFLGRIDNSPDAVRAAVLDCLNIETADGLVFQNEVEVEPIVVADRYPGVRAKIRGNLAGARFVIQLDIGIDDAVVPEPGWFDYPSILEEEGPRILAYHPATAVAEKFEAMVDLGLINSRMRDFFDIWMLAGKVQFSGTDLVQSIQATFTRRDTPIPSGPPIALTAEFSQSAPTIAMWNSYRGNLTQSRIEAPESLDEIIDVINRFIMPATQAAANGSELPGRWIPGQGWIEGPTE